MNTLTIHTTTDYDIFIPAKNNRPVNNTKQLEMSMRTHGWIKAFPMVVRELPDGRYQIVSGHHRLAVARMISEPAVYAVTDCDATLTELETSTNKWTASDVLYSHIRDGRTEYNKMKRFCDNVGVSIDQAIQIMSERNLPPSQARLEFWDGTFKYRNAIDTTIVANCVSCAKQVGASWASDTLFVATIMKMMAIDGFDAYRMKTNILKSKRMLVAKPRFAKDLANTLDKIYNKSGDVFPLVQLFRASGKKNKKK